MAHVTSSKKRIDTGDHHVQRQKQAWGSDSELELAGGVFFFGFLGFSSMLLSLFLLDAGGCSATTGTKPNRA
jgi:hypothetical protein